jgi:hypothetical protein
MIGETLVLRHWALRRSDEQCGEFACVEPGLKAEKSKTGRVAHDAWGGRNRSEPRINLCGNLDTQL